MIRWVLLLLLGLNLAYLAFGLHRSHEAGFDPYADVTPLEPGPEVPEIRLIDSLADSPPTEAKGSGDPPGDP
ncbi:hypothetical protein [Thioalkalivibrio sp.]|uniref:hypothetical protein n=1 Tax=Thioalkalivibrio sp. TaxID=2093813 RepID=UPI003976524A